MYQVAGRPDADYAPEQLNVALHLAAAKQTIDIGPLFVLSYAQ